MALNLSNELTIKTVQCFHLHPFELFIILINTSFNYFKLA